MMDWRRYSLATVTAALLAAVTTVFLGGYFVFDYFREAKYQREKLDLLSKSQVKESAIALADPVWNVDSPQIEKIIEAMAGPQSIYAMRLDTEGKSYGRIRDREWHLIPWDGKAELPQGLVGYEYPVTLDGRNLGDLHMYVSLERVFRAELRDLRQRLVTTVVVVDVLLIAAVYLLLSLTVLRPIRAIE